MISDIATLETTLLVAKGYDGVDTHGPPRRDVAGNQRHAHQQDGDSGESQGIRCAYAVEQAGHQARKDERESRGRPSIAYPAPFFP